MLVQCWETKRELEMVWIYVAAFLKPEVEDILKRYAKASDENWEWHDEDDWTLCCRLVSTKRNHDRILTKLIKKGYLHKYENWK